MTTYDTHYAAAAALLRISGALHSTALRLRVAARALDRWLEHRRVANQALDDLAAMSDRDLRDIGLSRSDVPFAAWRAADPMRDAP